MNLSNFGAVRHSLLSAAVLAFLAASASAQMVEKERTFADLTASHPCASGYTGRNAIVTDCDAADDIGDGGGAFRCFAHCDGTAPWESVSIGGGGTGGTGDVLLAGDADGQVIQGFTGEDKARIDIGVTDASGVRLIGTGATPGFIFAHTDGVYSESPDGNTSFDLYNAGVDIDTDGAASFAGVVSTNLGSPLGFTGIGGSRVNITSLQTPPTNANDTCTAGDTIDTATFHYYCAATDTWVRVAMATWP